MFNFKRRINRKSPQQEENRTDNISKNYIEEALSWEVSRVDMLERSERTAWLVAKSACLVAILAVGGVVVLLPLKETKPYLVRVDNRTGAAEVVQTSLNSNPIGYDEVIDKYWLAKFTRAHECFDWHTIQEDYDTVRLMSSVDVGKDYANLFEGPVALDKKYGSSTIVSIDIISVVPTDNGIATVRLIKKIRSRETEERSAQLSNWIATIGYEYHATSKFREQERLINPIGFYVKSYRVDPEINTARAY